MRYPADTLQAFACSLLVAAGLERDMAAVVAEVLLEGDLLGHDTHGLALLAPYLGELERGTMAKSGSRRVIEQRKASALWDGGRLPGPWLTRLAIDDAIQRALPSAIDNPHTAAAYFVEDFVIAERIRRWALFNGGFVIRDRRR